MTLIPHGVTRRLTCDRACWRSAPLASTASRSSSFSSTSPSGSPASAAARYACAASSGAHSLTQTCDPSRPNPTAEQLPHCAHCQQEPTPAISVTGTQGVETQANSHPHGPLHAGTAVQRASTGTQRQQAGRAQLVREPDAAQVTRPASAASPHEVCDSRQEVHTWCATRTSSCWPRPASAAGTYGTLAHQHLAKAGAAHLVCERDVLLRAAAGLSRQPI